MTWMTCMMQGMVPCSCMFMLYLKKLDRTAGRKVQVRHGRHDVEGLRLNTCFCQLCHGNHEWMKGLAEALKVNTAWSSRPQPNVSSSHGFNDKFGLGWLPFRTPSVSCHSTRLNIGSTLQRSAKVTCTLHCRTALFVGISVRFIISFKWPPTYVKTSASWTISLREVAIIESMGKNMQKCHPKKNDMDDLHDARHGPLFMLYLKKLDRTAGRKVQVRHGRHDMEGLRLSTCFCQLCHGNHEWMKGLAEALKINTAFIFKAPAKRFIEPWFQWQIWFGLTSFQNTFSIMSLHKAQHWLNPPKVCKSNLHTALSHCTAPWHFSALHYQFQMAPIIRENVCVLDNFSAWSSINRINWQKYAKMLPKKNDMDDLHDAGHGPLFMHVHSVPQEARLDCRSESPGSSWSPWHGKSTTEHMFLPALSWKPRVNERSGWSPEGQHGVIFKAPAKCFIEPWFQWQIWFGLTSFQNTFSIMSLHKAQHWLNPPKVCKSNLHTALSHCTASWHFSALHYQFQMARIIRENLCVLDNFSAWSSNNRINGQKNAKMPPKRKWHGWPAWCTAWSLVHACSCCTSISSTGLQVGKSRFVMVAMTWKVYDWTHVFASFVMETTSEWKVWLKPWRSTRRDLQGPSQTFHPAMVSIQIWFGLTSFQNTFSIMSLHKAQHWLNIGSTLAQPSKGLQKSPAHCTAALQFETCFRNLGAVPWGPTVSLFELSGSPGSSQKPWRSWWSARLRPGPSTVHLEGLTKEGSGGTHGMIGSTWHDLTIPSLYPWEFSDFYMG